MISLLVSVFAWKFKISKSNWVQTFRTQFHPDQLLRIILGILHRWYCSWVPDLLIQRWLWWTRYKTQVISTLKKWRGEPQNCCHSQWANHKMASPQGAANYMLGNAAIYSFICYSSTFRKTHWAKAPLGTVHFLKQLGGQQERCWWMSWVTCWGTPALTTRLQWSPWRLGAFIKQLSNGGGGHI